MTTKATRHGMITRGRQRELDRMQQQNEKLNQNFFGFDPHLRTPFDFQDKTLLVQHTLQEKISPRRLQRTQCRKMTRLLFLSFSIILFFFSIHCIPGVKAVEKGNSSPVLERQKPTLHMIGLFHTITSLNYSHCAFTGKVLRFPRMMHQYGWRVIEYGNVLTESGADEFVPLMDWQEFSTLVPTNNRFHGDVAEIGTPWHQRFEARLIEEMRKRVEPYDIVCHPFGHSHQILPRIFDKAFHVESGIGYPTTFLPLRIFESYAKMHYVLGAEQSAGKNYNWVIPNYFDTQEWRFSPEPSPKRPIVFMGRISAVKGMDVIREIALRMPERQFLLAGQGDPVPWFAGMQNVHFVGALVGRERQRFLSGAYAMLMPTTYVEPFGGAGVEAQLVGVPLIASNYGAFTETIEHGQTGFLCNTLGDWLAAIQEVEHLDRRYISRRAQERYGLSTVGKQYDAVFRTIYDLKDQGWYKNVSYRIP